MAGQLKRCIAPSSTTPYRPWTLIYKVPMQNLEGQNTGCKAGRPECPSKPPNPCSKRQLKHVGREKLLRLEQNFEHSSLQLQRQDIILYSLISPLEYFDMGITSPALSSPNATIILHLVFIVTIIVLNFVRKRNLTAEKVVIDMCVHLFTSSLQS